MAAISEACSTETAVINALPEVEALSLVWQNNVGAALTKCTTTNIELSRGWNW